jgi:F-type H+-transporting ATPase subunit a
MSADMPAHTHTPEPFDHVMDSDKWEFFNAIFGDAVEWHLPAFDIPLGARVYHFQITKFMVLELIAALLIILIYVPLSRRSQNGELPKGGWWNAFESLLTFVRNEIARPNLGEHDADKYVPYLWTLFLFLLFCNLLGMFPFMGSPTASIWVTGALACISFLMLHGAAIVKMGPIHYVQSLWPHIEVPYVGWFFSLAIFSIELVSTFIKSGVLAVRLFANMFAGHMVLAVILIFIYSAAQAGNGFLLGGVSVASVLGVVALSLLELFVAFLQAYIFVFLTALFMGMALHPEH